MTPDAATPVTVTVWVSLKSASVKNRAPFVVSGVVEPVTPAISVIGPPCTLDVITGTSLVPLMVTVTSWLAVPSLWCGGEAVGDRLAGAELLDARSGCRSALLVHASQRHARVKVP